MSKKFTPDLFVQESSGKDSFEVAWPVLSPKPETFSLGPGLKELEARALKEVRERALQIEKEAYEKGFEQGEKDGRELGFKRLEVVLHQLEKVLAEMEQQKREFFKRAEREVLGLMLAIGKRIFRQASFVQEETIVAVLKEAFQYVTDREKILVRLNPMDYQYLLAHPDQVPSLFDEKGGVRMVEDPSITRGGCLLDSSFGEVDATFESQFDEMVSLLLEARSRIGTEGHR